MSFFKKSLLCLAVAAAGCALTACQDDPAKQGGTYTAARHRALGSNIPQPSDVDNTGSVAGGPQMVAGPQVQTNASGIPRGAGH